MTADNNTPVPLMTTQDRVERFLDTMIVDGTIFLMQKDDVSKAMKPVEKIEDNTLFFEDGSRVEVPSEGIDVHRTRMCWGNNIIIASSDPMVANAGKAKAKTPAATRPAAIRFFLAEPGRTELCWGEKGNGKFKVFSNLRAEVVSPYMLADDGSELFIRKTTTCNFSVELTSPGGQTYIKEAASTRSVHPKEMVFGVSNLEKTLGLGINDIDSDVAGMLVGQPASAKAALPKMGLRLIKGGDPRFKGVTDISMLDADHADYRQATAAFCVSDVRVISVPTEWQVVRRSFLMDNANGIFLLSPKAKKHAMSRVFGG